MLMMQYIIFIIDVDNQLISEEKQYLILENKKKILSFYKKKK